VMTAAERIFDGKYDDVIDADEEQAPESSKRVRRLVGGGLELRA
jgi:hypothetical protein